MTEIVAKRMNFEEARECADKIKVGIFNVGKQLLALYEGDGWQALGYSSWSECAQIEFGYKQSHVYYLLDTAKIERNIFDDSETSESSNNNRNTAPSVLHPLTDLAPVEQREVYQRAVETAPNGKVTAAHVQAVKEAYWSPETKEEASDRLVFEPVTFTGNAKEYTDDLEDDDDDGFPSEWDSYSVQEKRAFADGAEQTFRDRPLRLAAANHVISDDPDYDGDEWYTPVEYIEAARAVLGSIDLDPATCEAAQSNVKAANFYTKEDDSLRQGVRWHGNVWLNPPYSARLIIRFVDKLVDEYDCGNVKQAIIITNNSSDTAWFHKLIMRFPACFTRGRVKFWRPNTDDFGARQGQTLFYLGNNVEGFCREFSQLGAVVKRI